MIILIVILFIIILWILTQKNQQTQKQESVNIITQIYEQPRINVKKRVIIPYKYHYDNRPAFRGLVHKYHTMEKDENGGSKPFQHKTLDNTNLNNNKIKYVNYGSYRIKPTTKKDLRN